MKHVEWTCRIINSLLCFASRWTIINLNNEYFHIFKFYRMLLWSSKGGKSGENRVIILIHGRGEDDYRVHVLNRWKSKVVVKHMQYRWVIIQWILRKLSASLCFQFVWFRKSSSTGSFEYDNDSNWLTNLNGFWRRILLDVLRNLVIRGVMEVVIERLRYIRS